LANRKKRINRGAALRIDTMLNGTQGFPPGLLLVSISVALLVRY